MLWQMKLGLPREVRLASPLSSLCVIEQWQWQQQNASDVAATVAVSLAKIFHCSHALAYFDPKSTPITVRAPL